MAESILQGGKEDLLTLRSMIEKQDNGRKRAEELAKSLSALTKEIESKKKEMNAEIDSTMKARQAEIENTYNKEITELNKSKKKIQNDKAKVKSAKVSERMGSETEEMYGKIKSLKLEINSRVREYRLPGMCKHKLFYAVFMPHTFLDIVFLIAAFIVLFLLLPCTVFTLLDGKPFGPTFTPAIVYVVDIVLFGGLYMLINNLVKDKHSNEVKGIGELLNQIRDMKKRIRHVKRSIQLDTDESGYGLESYDVELKEMEAKLNGLSADEKAALETFSSETKPMLTNEIKRKYESTIEALSGKYNEQSAEYKQVSETIRNDALVLSTNYEAQLGKSNMTVAVMDRLLSYMESGKASTIAEALEADKEAAAK